MIPTPASVEPTARVLVEGAGWRVSEMVCQSGPADPVFEEQHAWAVLAAVVSGTFTYRAPAGRALMAPGSLLLGNAGICFTCGHEHGVGDRCISVQISPAFLERAAEASAAPVRTVFGRVRIPPVDAVLPMLAQIRAVSRASDPVGAEGAVLMLAADILTLDQDTQMRPPSPREEMRVAAALRFMEKHFTEPLTVPVLAREVALGPGRFVNVFRRVTGTTPYQYLLRLRLDAAAQALEDRQSSVLDIALAVGFGDLSEFTRRFRARFGLPPAQYRRALGRRV